VQAISIGGSFTAENTTRRERSFIDRQMHTKLLH
jgi:hypothetical protein